MVRHGRGGGVNSPTSTRGVIVSSGWLLAMVGWWTWLSWRSPMIVFSLGLIAWGVREAWAWFAASEEERARFVALVKSTEPLRPSLDKPLGTGFTPVHVALIWGGVCVSVVGCWLHHPAWLLATMFLGAVGSLALLDLFRGSPNKE